MRRLLPALLAVFFALTAWAQDPIIGVVIMHGKGGSPQKFVSELAAYLEHEGCLVANLEMPWSGRRAYDAGVADADAQVAAALADLRAKGATRVFVAGHSQGGLFALHSGGVQTVDGVIAIAPGGSTGSSMFRAKLGATMAQARQLVAEGKGGEQSRLADYEGSKGMYPISTAPAIYLEWFDPDGAMNQQVAERLMHADIPVLYVAPTGDYPALRAGRQANFDALPARSNPLTELYEPDASHLGAPSAAREEILRWMRQIANPTHKQANT